MDTISQGKYILFTCTLLTLLQSHPTVKPFKNKGFPHFDDIQKLIPMGQRNKNVFHPQGTASQVSTSKMTPTGSSFADSPMASDDISHIPSPLNLQE
ncbi:hypothetical protein PAXINDRAFT_172551, partial [Paxillus involutus ATCC 200175]